MTNWLIEEDGLSSRDDKMDPLISTETGRVTKRDMEM